MQEFASRAKHQLQELPPVDATSQLRSDAIALESLVSAKARSDVVASAARGLALAVLHAYPFETAPARVPELKRGASLFEMQCVSCHGPRGAGDGPAAAALVLKPADLSDRERARQRSIFAIHQVISNGVDGTSMPSFSHLPDGDRWALAFFVSTLSYTNADRERGRDLWRSTADARKTVPSLATLSNMSEVDLATRADQESASALVAYLRSEPQVLAQPTRTGVAIAKARLAESIAAVRSGNRTRAESLALASYLDGFEPIEPALALKDRSLFERIEKDMVAYRAKIQGRSVGDLAETERSLQSLLDQASSVLDRADGDAQAAFVGALTILLREGLEALLIVVAMVAFLKKAERKDVLVYVHSGWVAALVAGVATWGAATYLIDVSGASRELTEGASALFAAIVLLGVGVWMHHKSVAGRWQVYLKQKLSSALNRRTAWLLFSLAFISVYREVFETVLFYAALWTEGNGWPLLGGLATGAMILAAVAYLLLRTSMRLPIGKFFSASAWLVALLAVVLAGKGITGLQEAGMLPTNPAPIPRIDVLGIYPSWQPLIAQLVVCAFILVAFASSARARPPLAARGV